MPTATIIGTVLVLVLVFGTIFALWRWISRESQIQDRREEAATAARAEVIGVGASHTNRESGETSVRLRLRVVAEGREPYEAAVTWDVMPASIPEVQVGKQIAVKIDLQDPRIVFPSVDWARYSWLHAPTKSDDGST
jgi:Flp pilus assembly protein CpaB